MQQDSKQELAKIGMVATLGLTVATSLKMKGINKKIHIGAGVAFCGFALWHHLLYQKKAIQNKQPKPINDQ
jgi:hypothetical protein